MSTTTVASAIAAGASGCGTAPSALACSARLSSERSRRPASRVEAALAHDVPTTNADDHRGRAPVRGPAEQQQRGLGRGQRGPEGGATALGGEPGGGEQVGGEELLARPGDSRCAMRHGRPARRLRPAARRSSGRGRARPARAAARPERGDRQPGPRPCAATAGRPSGAARPTASAGRSSTTISSGRTRPALALADPRAEQQHLLQPVAVEHRRGRRRPRRARPRPPAPGRDGGRATRSASARATSPSSASQCSARRRDRASRNRNHWSRSSGNSNRVSLNRRNAPRPVIARSSRSAARRWCTAATNSAMSR